jgi:uncharacterized cysteine cluster protein YcgN (CxxCxxCC family)
MMLSRSKKKKENKINLTKRNTRKQRWGEPEECLYRVIIENKTILYFGTKVVKK